MIKLDKTVSVTLAIGVMLVALSGCQKKEGPAEQAGKQADQAAAQAGEQIEKTGDAIQDAAKDKKD